MKKKVLIIEDDSLTVKMYVYWLAELLKLKKDVIPVIVSAPSVDEAREKFLLNPDIDAIVFDGRIFGPSAIDSSLDPKGIYPNSVVLVGEFRKTFKGPMIACSSHEDARKIQMEAGCDYEVDDKNKVAEKLIEIFGL